MRNASRKETRRRARRGVSPFWSWWEVTVSGLGRGEEVVRRGAEVGWDARCCVKVATRRLLEEQTAVVIVPVSGERSDAMWHVPQCLTINLCFLILFRQSLQRINVFTAQGKTEDWWICYCKNKRYLIILHIVYYLHKHIKSTLVSWTTFQNKLHISFN